MWPIHSFKPKYPECFYFFELTYLITLNTIPIYLQNFLQIDLIESS